MNREQYNEKYTFLKKLDSREIQDLAVFFVIGLLQMSSDGDNDGGKIKSFVLDSINLAQGNKNEK